MKIKLAILEKDESYLKRIATAFGSKYADKFQIYSFTDQNTAMDHLDGARIDVLLASDCFDINVDLLPNRCGFAYLIDAPGIDMLNDQRAICKFQKADLIYKQILSVYAEKASSITGFKVSGDESTVIAFCSASGGVGCSTMAAACATRFAKHDKKVLYLNLEKFGSADMFFSGQGQFDMSDIIFALKSKKANLPLKLESCVKQDANGVHFYSGTKFALDMMEMTTENTIQLISELKFTGGYDYIVLDMDFGIDCEMLKIYRLARSIVWVGDGSAESNKKIERAYAALEMLERDADVPLINRMSFVYNKVGSKSGQQIDVPGLKVLGGAPRYAGASVHQIVGQLSAMNILDGIF